MNKLNRKKICLIQLHHTDFQYPIDEYNPIQKIKDSNLFEEIILICPDVEENKILEKISDRYGVELFFGSVSNVTQRMLAAAKKYNGSIIARPSIRWFFTDTEIISKMVNVMEETGCDYVQLPYDYDERFGAEVFSIDCLKRLDETFSSDVEIGQKYQFSPAGYLEVEKNDFDIRTVEHLPVFTIDDFNRLKPQMDKAWPECGKGQDYSDRPMNSYSFVSRFVEKDNLVLDIACGTGQGSALISENAQAMCIGVDMQQSLITNAKERYSSVERVDYICDRFENLDFQNEHFDRIVSLHTMEHIDDDEAFLSKMYDFLKPGGKLLLEVPVLRTKPFEDVHTPINPDHFREYKIDMLKEMVGKFFRILSTYGVNHGFYTSENKTRNAFLVIAEK